MKRCQLPIFCDLRLAIIGYGTQSPTIAQGVDSLRFHDIVSRNRWLARLESLVAREVFGGLAKRFRRWSSRGLPVWIAADRDAGALLTTDVGR